MRCAAAFLLLLAGCGDRVERQTLTIALRVPESGPCRPEGSLGDLVFEALGDFPASDERTIDVVRSIDPGTIDRFPADTRVVTVQTLGDRWSGFGAVALPEFEPVERTVTVLLLPPNESCPLADPALADLGGALIPLADGSLVFVGGSEGAVGSRQLLHWRSGAVTADRVEPGLQVRRAGVVAVRNGERVYALGGALGDEGPAHDTYEVYDAETGAMAGGLRTLLEPRRDAGATRLPNGDLLLVGGRATGGGPPLATAERIASGVLAIRAGELPEGRARPLVRTLDDGSVVVVGGTNEGGTIERTVLAFDPRSDGFVELLVTGSDPAEAVPLPGGRLVIVGGDGSLTLYRNAPPILGPVPGLVETPLGTRLPALREVAAVALLDGRLLVSGLNAVGENRRAFVLDVGEDDWTELPAPRAYGRLVGLADGTTVALDPDGAAIRRVSERSTFGNPPASLLAEDLALDGPGRWRSEGATLVADAPDARADLAGLRFADVSIELQTAGSVELLLQPEGGPATAIRIEDDEVGPTLCPLEGAGTVTLERRGESLLIERGGFSRSCRLTGLDARVGLALRARTGGRFERVEVRRLELE